MTSDSVDTNGTLREECCICQSVDLETLLDFPSFPFTGIFVSPGQDRAFPDIDLSLQYCQSCGHGQLFRAVDPVFLYQDTYQHRSSGSPIARRGNDYFLEFVDEVSDSCRFNSVVEVGCNDLYLLQNLEKKAENLCGIDPIWKGESIPGGSIKVIGEFVENIDLDTDVSIRPDLVVAVHVLEHVCNPVDCLRQIYDYAEDGALFVIEVPCFDSLLTACRFDQVFHQHINYFSLASLQRIIHLLGAEYVAHRLNYNYWQGTIMVAFRKSKGDSWQKEKPALAPVEYIENQYALFRQQMGAQMAIAQRMVDRGICLYGYGAAQMVPTLAYHMESDMSFLQCILDDNPEKNNMMYPNLNVSIRNRIDLSELRSSAVMITALDSARAIMKNLIALNARHILYPLNLF